MKDREAEHCPGFSDGGRGQRTGLFICRCGRTYLWHLARPFLMETTACEGPRMEDGRFSQAIPLDRPL